MSALRMLSAVWFVSACRRCVREKEFSKIDDVLLYVGIAFLGVVGGIVVGLAIIWRFGDDWSGAQARLIFAACALAATSLLTALTWGEQREVVA